MKILMVGDAASPHIQSWQRELSRHGGHEVLLATQASPNPRHQASAVEFLPFRGSVGYLRNASALRKLARRFNPDVVNAHYASGYGTTASLARVHPLAVSVWGSDVYEFPDKSRAHRKLLAWNLRKADAVGSTSEVMRDRVLRTHRSLLDVRVTPFGVDTDLFRPRADSIEDVTRARPLVVGTVKTLAPKYGVDVLIDGFAEAARTLNSESGGVTRQVRLKIIGDGPERKALEHRA
jgi:glycosyltransferase involved in cell wall biosynthesis